MDPDFRLTGAPFCSRRGIVFIEAPIEDSQSRPLPLLASRLSYSVPVLRPGASEFALSLLKSSGRNRLLRRARPPGLARHLSRRLTCRQRTSDDFPDV